MGKIKYIVAKGLKKILNPPALKNCKIDATARICARSELSGCEVGRYTYIGYQNFMVNVDIGSFCSIADRCSIGGAAHPINFVSSSPVFHEGKNILGVNFSNHKIVHTPKTVIKNDVWIGQGAFIKAGVTIGNGAVVGMGAVLTKDVGPYEIWAGNPAKKIRDRFDIETRDRLLASNWWNWNDNLLQEKAYLFDDVNKFLDEKENGKMEKKDYE